MATGMRKEENTSDLPRPGRPPAHRGPTAPAGPGRPLGVNGQLLGLQRAAGNRAVTQLLTGAKPTNRAVPTVQRRPWLDDEGKGKYKERGVDPDLAFVGVIGGRDNQGLFMAHDRLDKLFDWGRDYRFAMAPGITGNLAKSLEKAVGVLWFELGNETVEVADGYTANLAVRLALLTLARHGGYRLRREGGGSRFPTAKGTLVFDEATFADRDDVLLKGCTIPQEKVAAYSLVTGEPLAGRTLADVVATAKGNGRLTWEGEGFAYVSDAVAHPAAGRQVLAAGRPYDERFTGVTEDTKKALAASFDGLGAPAATGWVTGLSGGRDGSQSKAMDRWSALGAAAYFNTFRGGDLPLNHNWEWLHVRGAQIGGDTAAGNLVPGTFAANSEMIPYEALLNRWQRGNTGKIWASFSTIQRTGVIAEKIVIKVYTQDHSKLGTVPQGDPLSVEFSPTGDWVVDKLLGRLRTDDWSRRAAEKGTPPDEMEVDATPSSTTRTQPEKKRQEMEPVTVSDEGEQPTEQEEVEPKTKRRRQVGDKQ